MLIDVKNLLKEQSGRLDFDYMTPSPEHFGDIEFTGDTHIKGYVLNQGGYLSLSADATLPFRTHCARCWKDVETQFSLHFDKSLAVKNTLENEDNDDYLIITDNKVDLDTPLLEAAMLEFPYTFLCKEDCKGLCTKCGKDLNEGECGCPKKEIDPRLEILKKLLDK